MHSIPSLGIPPIYGFLFVLFFVPPSSHCNSSSVGLVNNRRFWPFRGRSTGASFFYTSLLQAIDGVMSSALCAQVVPQAPQHFSSDITVLVDRAGNTT